MSIEVYKQPLFRRYFVSSYASSACVFMLAVFFLMVFLPLFLVYNSTAFWLKDNTYYEQPNIQFMYKTIFQFQGESISVVNGELEDLTKAQKLELYWSSESLLNDLHNDNIRPSLISSSEHDTNRDGLLDRLELTVKLPIARYDPASNATTQSKEHITGFESLIFFEVRVQDRARYIFDAVSHFSYHSSNEGMGNLYVDSNLVLRQREKLTVKGGFQTPYQSDPLLGTLYEDTPLSDVQMLSILQKSAARNLTLGLDHNFVYAEPDVGSDYFTCNFMLRVPEQYITYSPGVSEVLKYAWIQFAAVFIVIYFLLDRINSFVFSHKLLYAYEVPDMVVKKMD